ncbi:unnamed protein product [Paramecium primaurelia]|uniref:Transmembrane protein n=1 Tax=Paramecium primaurelia TaxID=5886 RepID=A0A8S1PVQ0_PARPR|nr:unnamed protein product [Paramecium primaurelia]
MKFVYTFILYIAVVKCSNSFTFQLNSGDLSRTTLEFSANHPVYQLSLRCDSFTTDLWIAYNYANLTITPEQRQQYKCSDKNFTITLSNDFTDEYATIFVYNQNKSVKIQSFDFLTDSQTSYKTALTANKATTQGLYYVKNDFSMQVSYPSTMYVEILKCPTSESKIEVMQFNEFGQYRNLDGNFNNKFFYDVFNASNGSTYYRLQQSHYDSPDVFIKYQRAQQQQIKDIKSYINYSYFRPSVQVKGDKIFISFPDFKVKNYEQVELRVTVGWDGSETKEIICAYGDPDIWRQYNSYYINKYNLTYNIYGNNQLVADFPSYIQGSYNIRTTAIVNFGTIKQTIPMQTVQIYRNLYAPSGSLLVHILAPIIISVLALFGLIVGGCKYRKKKALYLQDQQLGQLQQQHQIQNPYIGIQ